MKTKKRTKSSRMHGHNQGTHGHGARKKWKGKGHRGGKGLSGTGKRGDQKKTRITKLYGHSYFGKQGVTSRGTRRDTRKRINLCDIQHNLERYGKKTPQGWEIQLKEYKVLGKGEIKEKIILHAQAISASAQEKIKKAGGTVVLKDVSEKGKEHKGNKPLEKNA